AAQLLRMAADWYWELDRDFRFSHVADPRRGDDDSLQALLGQRSWDLADPATSEVDVDAHRADLEAHRPFAGFLVCRSDAAGRGRVHALSGEPRVTAQGVFTGYWGTARDVNDELQAQRAALASEARYRELFERSPSPLYLHRDGVVYDANAAAARLFGFADARSMHGLPLVDLFEPGETQQRVALRLQKLDSSAVGAGLPVTDLQARTADGRSIFVQATGVRVDAPGGPATLSIFFDVSERKVVEAALRRSEAMLSQLFTVSPDCITLSELPSGRHTMANMAFLRLTGYSAAEVIGRTATELGLWVDLRDRDRLLTTVERDGRAADVAARIRSRSGDVVSVLISAARFAMDGRAYLVVNARDVTEAEQTRLEHAAIFERASVGIAMTRQRCFVQANPCFEAIFGWPPGSLIGEPGSAVWVSDDDYAEIGRIGGPLLAAGEAFGTEREMRKKDGSRFWCHIVGQAVDPMRPTHGGTIWVAEDVTERHQLVAELAAARDAAEAASRAKSAFLANTSHEIRTPLNGLMGLARLALRDHLDPALRRRHIEQINESARGLEGILSDILDFSKIEAGKFTLETSSFDLRELVQAVHSAYRALAEAKGLTFTVAVGAELAAHYIGDPVRIRQVLSNFITNAVKFTDRGSVRIEASAPVAGGIRLAVIDTGNGLDEAQQAQLFEPFAQGDSGATRRYGGTGLGLSICRQLAALMGGKVGVTSAPGSGSSFWAELPLPISEVADDDLDAASDAADGATAGKPMLGPARVLLVEDNEVNMLIAAATIAQWGLEVEQASDGQAAVAAVAAAARGERPFDIVLMDLQMPVMGGHEATRELRKTWSSRQLPIIALTAAALVGEREQALAAGMNDFLTKPIDSAKLRRTLLRYLRSGAGTSSPH
ncbi:MAG: PAS domain S-box protein, partial [Pseudomonadota bacterium]|nr:PAS domain S-box protein [Pseudomonadota bacterium]